MKKMYFALVLFLMTTVAFSQGTITGTVIDGELNEPLPGASVVLQGTTNGTSTDFDGKFQIEITENAGTLLVSYIGYTPKKVAYTSDGNIGRIVLEPNAQELEGVVVSGVIDIAKDRETPVAVSTIKAAEIQEKLGSQEFPEILKSTPSIYVTKQGGGFGDARISIRGFNTNNSAVMVNGVPVNDMENGAVYWSNWSGLSDVASAIQVQRGLGSSKLATSSVGGTINVVTKTSEQREGGVVSGSVGNADYLKTLVAYSTGLMENGLSASVLLGRTAGSGYVDGTEFEAYNYFIGIGYKPNEKHDLQFIVTGSPQQHHSRSFAPSLGNYLEYGSNGEDPNIKYNSDWGNRNGKEDTFGGNFYHKPVVSLNWEWELSDTSTFSAIAYASFGRGGSVGSLGRINGNQSFSSTFKTADGLIRMDDIVRWNQGANVPDFGTQRQTYTSGGALSNQGLYVNGNNSSFGFEDDNDFVRGGENGISQRSSVNSHNWYGTIMNFHNEVNNNWSFDVGVDARSYKGYHYRRLVDLLGADAYVDNDNINDTFRTVTETYAPTAGNALNVFSSIDDEEKVDYYNIGYVRWLGAFGQVEYKNDNVSAFMQGSFSNQGFQREDLFNYLDSDPEQKTDWVNQAGGNVKGGLNYNINEKHNVFVNAGYYLKQPLFDAVFLNFVNDINPDLENEKILGVELGYGFRSAVFSANVNLYRTSWKDRFESDGITVSDLNGDVLFQGTANYSGVEQLHTGVEVDFTARATPILTFNGMVSVGNWEYTGNPTGTVLDDGRNVLGTAELILDGVKVGDAAQFTARIGATIEPVERLKFDASYYRADNLYADFDVLSFQDNDLDGVADNDGFLLELPAYDLVDAGVSYKMLVGKEDNKSITLRLNINNVLDDTYISESETNVAPDSDPLNNYDGINTGNRVYFGFGRTWNFTLNYRF
ncbi:TonB-dependent receptor [Zobellia barbeyronii]|uniref:TonB-dependent receptor n=1 Tax=Zobellia barbeyronii TaxID=2748009 RepID=A0ABS5WAV4_9FLAO|nr:TonB-dependent receptor [Zobellia barbeyronii]MBT2160063.1 TonB-dependent receptor [Zobellia barbeyronii]